LDEAKNRQIIIIAIVVILILAVVGYLLAGVKGIASMLTFLKWAIMGVLIIGLAVWAVWFLFIRKIKDDRVALNVKMIMEQARLTKPETIGDLYISGDINHPQIKLGGIIGYTRIKNIRDEEEDVFIWKKFGMPLGLFEEPKAIRIHPDDHSRMIGDIVVKGIALVSHGGFYYINKEHLDLEGVDKTIKAEVLRKFTIDTLRDIKIISDMGIGINPEHQKALEQRSLLKIPSRQEPIQPVQGSYENPRG